MPLVVVSHTHHADEGVYRLVVGQLVEHVVPMLDADGVPLVPDEPVLDDSGEPVLDDDGAPVTRPGEPMTETRTVLVAAEDFVFAAEDERWQDRAPEEVAADQRQIVKDALDRRAAEAERAEAARTAAASDLGGVGELL